MIYTCTTNPSLDYYISLDNMEKGRDNRSEMEIYEAGGKGVNVSIILNNFMIPSVALGFLGGFTKDYYLSFIQRYPYIQPLFTTIKDNTRINIKIMESDDETGLNAKGPHISEEEFEKFKKRFMNIYDDDIFVVSGNIEDDIKDKMIELIHDLAKDGIRVVLDTDKDVIDACLDIKPLLVKINRYYFDNMSDETIISTGKKMIENGVQNVMFSSANMTSYMFTKDKTYCSKNLDNSLVNATGSADSMVGGYLYSIIRGADAKEAFKYANAASLATSMSNDMGSKEKIEETFDTIIVEEI